MNDKWRTTRKGDVASLASFWAVLLMIGWDRPQHQWAVASEAILSPFCGVWDERSSGYGRPDHRWGGFNAYFRRLGRIDGGGRRRITLPGCIAARRQQQKGQANSRGAEEGRAKELDQAGVPREFHLLRK
ncbi:MAG: hypothetical protein ACC647_01325 [Anaerolineales bacterium]